MISQICGLFYITIFLTTNLLHFCELCHHEKSQIYQVLKHILGNCLELTQMHQILFLQQFYQLKYMLPEYRFFR